MYERKLSVRARLRRLAVKFLEGLIAAVIMIIVLYAICGVCALLCLAAGVA